MRKSLKPIAFLLDEEAAVLLEYEREGGYMDESQVEKAIRAMRGYVLCTVSQFAKLIQRPAAPRSITPPTPIVPVDQPFASPVVEARYQADLAAEIKEASRGLRCVYACNTCKGEVLTKKPLDENRPIFCKDCRPKRVTPIVEEVVVIETVIVTEESVEPIQAKPVVPAANVVRYRAPALTAPAPIAAPVITAPPAEPETNVGCPPIAEEDSDFVIEDDDSESVEEVELSIWERAREDQLGMILEHLAKWHFRFGTTPPTTIAALQAKIEGTPKWGAMCPTPIEVIWRTLRHAELEAMGDDDDTEVNENGDAEAKLESEVSATDVVIELNWGQLDSGRKVRKVVQLLEELRVVKFGLIKPTTAIGLKAELKRLLGNDWMVAAQSHLSTIAKVLTN